MENIVDRYLTTDGPCTVVRGLPEEVTAMLFAFFSRNPKPIRETLAAMIEKGNLEPPPAPADPTSERSRKFHERTTIGYGHKSVADHANIHWCLENVSAVAERDFLSARLLAGTSKSTRYVDFRDAGYHTPEEWPDELRGEYDTHCEALMTAYESLIPVAEVAIRKIMPYDDKTKEIWKKESGWERATAKRALDLVRDLLPGSIKTSFAVTNSATALREMLDKRQTDDGLTPAEIVDIAVHVRAAARTAVPTLLPEEPRSIPRYPRPTADWVDGLTPHQRVGKGHKVVLVQRPSWKAVQIMTGISVTDLVRRWVKERGHNMVPDRTAEFAVYMFTLEIPWAIQRDLGRHRMMTQTEGLVSPNLGYGCDPLFRSTKLDECPQLALVYQGHRQALMSADIRLQKWMTKVDPLALQYACPLATIVPVRWVLNIRELVHIMGLRTVPQGHPSYRQVIQMVATTAKRADPFLAGIVDEVTNFDDVLIGRPG